MSDQGHPTLAIWKPEPRCSICRHPACGEISDLLVMRSRRQSLSDGTRVTAAWLVQVAPERWGNRFTEKSLSRHFARHLEPVATSAAVALKGEEAAIGDLATVLDQLDPAVATGRDLASGIVRAAALRLKRNPAGVSLDLGLKAAALLEKSAEMDRDGKLMGVLGGALSAALTPPKPPAAVVEAEIVAEDAVVVEAPEA